MNRILKAKIVENFGTQFEFSKVMGLHEAEVSRIVRTRRELSKENQAKWAAALNTEPENIFNQDD